MRVGNPSFHLNTLSAHTREGVLVSGHWGVLLGYTVHGRYDSYVTQVQNTDAMQAAFRLPRDVSEDAELVALHQEMVRRLQSESMGIPMHTVQELLLERIATEYVIIKWRESRDGWVGLGIGAEDKAKAHWKNLVSEWNRVLERGQETLRNALVQQVTQITMEALELIEDDESRKSVRLRLTERFAAIGL